MTQNKNELILEQKAINILNYLKKDVRYGEKSLPRPFMIEFTGTPSAGKTTTIKELYDFLRPLGFRVWRPQEGAEYIQNITRDTHLYNIATGLYSLDKLIHESFGHKYDIILFDRALYDAWCWMEYWFAKNQLSSEDKLAIQSFFTLSSLTNKLDLVYFMVCEAKVALAREYRVALSHRPRETTNPASIQNKQEIWRRAYSHHCRTNKNVRLIDTTNLDEQVMINNIATDILTTLESKSQPR